MSDTVPAIISSFQEAERGEGKGNHSLASWGFFAQWPSKLLPVIYSCLSVADFGSKDSWEL